MKIKRFTAFVLSLSALLLLPAFLTPVTAQDAEDEYQDEGRFGSPYAEIEIWVAQPSGLGIIPAAKYNPIDPYDVELLSPGASTETRARYRGGFKLAKDRGDIMVTYYSHAQETVLTRINPSNFVYGELLPDPTFAGFGNDGMADGFSSTAHTGLRDLRIDFYRTAFDTPRAKGKWFVGWRRVECARELDTYYHSLVPDLPALIPPLYEQPSDTIGLNPQPDRAYMSSRFNGRGVGAGLEIEMPLWKDELSFDGGLNFAILRGRVDSVYRSTTWYYELLRSSGSTILEPPYNEFEQVEIQGDEEIPLINSIIQVRSDNGLSADRLSSTAFVLEADLGVRWKAYKGVEWFGGFRSTRYTDIGLDLRASVAPTQPGSTLEPNQTNRSATYEGFYTGVSFSY